MMREGTKDKVARGGRRRRRGGMKEGGKIKMGTSWHRHWRAVVVIVVVRVSHQRLQVVLERGKNNRSLYLKRRGLKKSLKREEQ